MSEENTNGQQESEGKFGDGVSAPLFELQASRLKGGRLLTPNVIRVWPDRVEEHQSHAIRKSETLSIRYDQVAQITLSKGMMFSEIVVESTGGRIITMQGMAKKDAERVKGFLDTGADSARNGGTTTIVQQIPTAAPAASLADELTKLAKLRDDGILTDEEFAEQKAVLMNRPPAS
jgi:hypothetical protein